MKTPIANQGFFLYPLLIFIQIYLLLGTYGLEASQRNLVASHADWQSHRLLLKAKSFVEKLEKNLPKNACQIPSNATIPNQPLKWWMEYACHQMQDTVHYYYVVEKLDSNPCETFENQPNYQAAYYRVSLNALKASHQLILQSIVLIPEQDNQLSCLQPPYIVVPGEQLFRIVKK
jgi:hypothetical protein